MIARQLFSKTIFRLLIGLGAVGIAGIAAAQGTPSSKATFAYSSLVSLPACNTTDAAGCGGTSDTGWQPILRQQIKMANQKDLFFGASLQCGIVTDTTVKSMNGSLDTAEARGTIRVRIKITPPYGPAVYAQPSTGVDATNTSSGANGGVVFCADPQGKVLGTELHGGLGRRRDVQHPGGTAIDPQDLERERLQLRRAKP